MDFDIGGNEEHESKVEKQGIGIDLDEMLQDIDASATLNHKKDFSTDTYKDGNTEMLSKDFECNSGIKSKVSTLSHKKESPIIGKCRASKPSKEEQIFPHKFQKTNDFQKLPTIVSENRS